MHPAGKTLYGDDAGQLWVVTREVDRDGTTVYTRSRVTLELVDVHQFKWQAARAIRDGVTS